MKIKILTTTALVCCFMVCMAVVADLTGKWTGSLKTPDGNEIPVTYNLKIDGDKITGSADSPQGAADITDGKLTGNDLSFKVSSNGQDIPHTGKYYPAADSIGMNVDFNGTKMHFTLKRSNQ
ncbi:hypothetical protein [Mucilaginibacter sp.]|uniref:hypothetical protein n=1 Tax=Mucilaginibacter sp. TaxID=1882438 RepID=UPI003D0D93F6